MPTRRIIGANENATLVIDRQGAWVGAEGPKVPETAVRFMHENVAGRIRGGKGARYLAEVIDGTWIGGLGLGAVKPWKPRSRRESRSTFYRRRNIR